MFYFQAMYKYNFIILVKDLLSKVKAKFNIIEDADSDGLKVYERELSVTQQVQIQLKKTKRFTKNKEKRLLKLHSTK